MKPLLVTCEPFDDESLESIVYRHSLANCYPIKGSISNLIKDGFGVPGNPFSLTIWGQVQALCHLTGISAERIIRASKLIVFDQQVEVDSSYLKGVNPEAELRLRGTHRIRSVNVHIRHQSHTSYCPICLRQAIYHQRSWHYRPFLICLEHRVLLADHCLTCESVIKLSDLIQDCCPKCGSHYSAADPFLVSDVDNIHTRTAAFVRFLFGNELNNPLLGNNAAFLGLRKTALLHLWTGLQKIPNATKYYEQLFGKLVSPHPHKRMLIKMAIATHFLDNWPRNLQEYLEWRATNNSSENASRKIHVLLGYSFYGWLYSILTKPSLRMLLDEIDKFLFKRLTYSKGFGNTNWFKQRKHNSNLYDRIDLAEASRRLGINIPMLESFGNQGIIDIHQGDQVHPTKVGKYVFSKDIGEIRTRLKRYETLGVTAKRQGFSPETVLKLIDSRLIQVHRGPLIDGYNYWMIDRESVKALIFDLSSKCAVDDESVFIPLGETTRRLSNFSLGIADLFLMILSNEITARATSIPPKRLSDFEISLTDVEAFCSEKYSVRKGISLTEAKNRLGVGLHTLRIYIQEGILRKVEDPSSEEGRIMESELARFRKKYIQTHKAAELLDISPLVVCEWARAGRLHPVSGPGVNESRRYVFLRSDIESYVVENRLSAPQLAKELDLSKSQIYEWIRKGRVKPISGPGIDGKKQFLFLRDRTSVI